jgi:hypothetical protein
MVLEKMSGEACVVRSEVWEVTANFKWVAFGTPMFSRRLDAGYIPESKRTDRTRSSIEAPRRSFASSIVDFSSVPDLMAVTRTPRSSTRIVAFATLSLRSAVLVTPSAVSQVHFMSRPQQYWHTGRCPEHFVFLFRHSVHALLTGSGIFRVLATF